MSDIPNWHELSKDQQQAMIQHALLAVLRTLRREVPPEWLQHLSFGAMCWLTADPTLCTARFTDHSSASEANVIRPVVHTALLALLMSLDDNYEYVMDPR